MSSAVPEVSRGGGRAGRSLVALLVLGLSPAFALPPPGRVDSREGEAIAGEPEIHPEAISSFVTRTYRIRPQKLWDGLLEQLEKSGYPLEIVNEESMLVKTSFIEFKARDYSEETGGPPPRVSAEYPILQMKRVKGGKVSLEGKILQGKEGTDLAIRARILVQGLNQRERLVVLTDRRSSGVIEADFLRLLEDTLTLERL